MHKEKKPNSAKLVANKPSRWREPKVQSSEPHPNPKTACIGEVLAALIHKSSNLILTCDDASKKVSVEFAGFSSLAVNKLPKKGSKLKNAVIINKKQIKNLKLILTFNLVKIEDIIEKVNCRNNISTNRVVDLDNEINVHIIKQKAIK